MKKNIVTIALLFSAFSFSAAQPALKYRSLQGSLQQGWGTYNHRSVLSHVLLPHGFCLNVGIKSTEVGPADNYLQHAFISSRDKRSEIVVPGPRSVDGKYTELVVTWRGSSFKIQSALSENDELVLLITPLNLNGRSYNVILESGILWNRQGTVQRVNDNIVFETDGKTTRARMIGHEVDEYVAATTPYFAASLDKVVAFYTGEETKSLRDVENTIEQRRSELLKGALPYGNLAEVFGAIRNVLAWNIIFDPAKKRIIYPVSRLWNENFGGRSVLFCWDSYLSAYMMGMIDKNLAYANAIETTKAITRGGFVPNWSGSYDNASFDRSQPPVGSMVFKALYDKHKDRWVLEHVFEELLTWNRWWSKNRDLDGLLCYGSNKVYLPEKGDFAANTWQGAAYESGLDNSPMYDHVPFDKEKNVLLLADVGLMSLYVLDCESLADIAIILGRSDAAAELKKRAAFYRKNFARLWSEEHGIYLNLRMDTKEFSMRLSPTNFYPLLASVPSDKQARRMIKEHLMNPDEFFGEWILPSIARNDSAFHQQEYWRGRIWAPMNFLVYLGIRNYDHPDAKQGLVQKSRNLFMKNVNINGWIFENYNAITGNVSDQAEGRSFGDNYYHWGALLGFLVLMDADLVNSPTANTTTKKRP